MNMKENLKKIYYTIFKKHPYIYIYRLISKITPRKKIDVYYSKNYKGNKNLVEKFICMGLADEYYSMDERERRIVNKTKLWGSEGGYGWHKEKIKRYDDMNKNEGGIENRKLVISQISELMKAYPNRYEKICEIGTGNGIFLSLIYKKIKNMRGYIGLDINKKQILENKKKFDKELEFLSEDALEYAKKDSGKTIYMSCGTFEYFSQNELEELFEVIKSKESAAIVLCEPVNMDLRNERKSKIRGNTAYSHNYEYILKKMNYKIFRSEIKNLSEKDPTYLLVYITAIN